MIVTITPNTAIDQIVFIDEWQFDRTIRAQKTLQTIAGKPTDASWILAELGIKSLALGFKAGLTGELVDQILSEKGVQTDFIAVDGETRRNLVIVMQQGQHQTTITSATLKVSPDHVRQLEEKYMKVLDEATCVVLGGTLPTGVNPSFYARLIQLANKRNIPTILDASGPSLRAGVQGQPTYIMPNQDELGELVGYPITSIEAAYQAGCLVKKECGVLLIISLGAVGGIAILEDQAYRIEPLPVDVVSTAGAGDGILAGLAAAFGRRQPILEGIRLGFAAATAIVTQPGTAQCHAADIQAHYEQISIEPFQTPASAEKKSK